MFLDLTLRSWVSHIQVFCQAYLEIEKYEFLNSMKNLHDLDDNISKLDRKQLINSSVHRLKRISNIQIVVKERILSMCFLLRTLQGFEH